MKEIPGIDYVDLKDSGTIKPNLGFCAVQPRKLARQVVELCSSFLTSFGDSIKYSGIRPSVLMLIHFQVCPCMSFT